MKGYLVKTPKFVQRMFPKRVWTLPNSGLPTVKTENTVYLTFDDGPISEVTAWVLEELKKHHAKATFFCIGENIKKHPDLFQRIISEGHSVGNHTFNHLNGWTTKTEKYIENVLYAEEEMNKVYEARSTRVRPNPENPGEGGKPEDIPIFKSEISNQLSPISNLFRPPYGKLTSTQSQILRQKGYKIIMWDVLSGDFDTSISEESCFSNVSESIKPGSIVVFHDSLKAEKNLRFVLPKVLQDVSEKGWNCEKI
jgi:peptidoglycan-N-acetylglucosamine deacetylase